MIWFHGASIKGFANRSAVIVAVVCFVLKSAKKKKTQKSIKKRGYYMTPL